MEIVNNPKNENIFFLCLYVFGSLETEHVNLIGRYIYIYWKCVCVFVCVCVCV